MSERGGSVKYSLQMKASSSNFLLRRIVYEPSVPTRVSEYLLGALEQTINLGGTSYPKRIVINNIIPSARFSLLANLYKNQADEEGLSWPQNIFVLTPQQPSRERKKNFLETFLDNLENDSQILISDGGSIKPYYDFDGVLLKSINGSQAHSIVYNRNAAGNRPFQIKGPIDELRLSLFYWIDVSLPAYDFFSLPQNNSFHVDFDLIYY